MRSVLIVCAGASLLGLVASALAAPGVPAATPALAPGPERDTVARVCSGCHAPEIVTHQRLSAQGWRDMVELMAANGAVATDAELEQITAYLIRSYPDEGAPAPASTGGGTGTR